MGPLSRWRSSETAHSEMGERLIAGVPARIMRPRLIFLICLAAIVSFGILMVYSASSVEALKEHGSATYYLVRQVGMTAIGLAGMAFVCLWGRRRDDRLDDAVVWRAWALVVALLLIVFVAGTGGEEWGASRWLRVGPVGVQPSELAKPAVITVCAYIMSDYYGRGACDTASFMMRMAAALLVPLTLIFIQPDMGTTFIILAAVVIMMFLEGLSWRIFLGGIAVGLVAGLLAIFTSEYRLNRFMVMIDPWRDPYGDGYQATLAIMAFASGGLFGRGIGNSTMKYSFLPEAHNDYILGIIGEEVGFVGVALFIAVFLLMLWAAAEIAREAPTLHGQLLASGSAAAIAIQFFVNVMGIVGIIPMTGKPLPFVSYGGSAMIASLLLAGLILRVSLESNRQTVSGRRRASMEVVDDGDIADRVSDHIGRSTAGTARVRSTGAPAGPGPVAGGARPRPTSRPFSVVNGGPARTGRAGDAGQRAPYRPGSPYRRIELAGSGSDRLRHDGLRGPGGRYDGEPPRDRPRGNGRDRHGR